MLGCGVDSGWLGFSLQTVLVCLAFWICFCISVSESSSDSDDISAQVFLANFGTLVRPISSKARRVYIDQAYSATVCLVVVGFGDS